MVSAASSAGRRVRSVSAFCANAGHKGRLPGGLCRTWHALCALLQLVDLSNTRSLRCTATEDILQNSMYNFQSGRAWLTGGKDMVRLRLGILAQHTFLALLLILLSSGTASAGRAKPSESGEAVIAIGDVHGDYDDFVAIL